MSERLRNEKTVGPVNPSLEQLNPDFSSTAFKCTICSLKLNSTIALMEHKNKEHNLGDSSLKEETETVFENEVFKCNKCAFKCLQPSVFYDHVKTGHTKPKFVCNICRNDFSFLKLYLNHMKNHAACAVIYSCNECRFSSKKAQIFVKHMRTHALKTCPMCDYKTLRSDSFKSHLITIHTVENENSTSWNACVESCTTTLMQINKNVDKVLDSTSNIKIIKHACCFCSYHTDQIFNLRKHMAIHFRNSDSSKNDQFSDKVSKSSLAIKRWKNKTLPAR